MKKIPREKHFVKQKSAYVSLITYYAPQVFNFNQVIYIASGR